MPVLLVLLLAIVAGPATAGATPASAGSLPPGRIVRLTWTPLFPWTPAAGEAGAAAWPRGQCTWFVVSEGYAGGDHRVHWSGDAWLWENAAAAAGATTEPATVTPQPGWIAVYARGHGSSPSAGHVALVVAVSASDYTVAEANYLGPGVVDERGIAFAGEAPLLEGWIT